MSFSLTTNRLILQVENDTIADKVLKFYEDNRLYFDPYEPTRPNNFYTLAYQEASMRFEQSETLHGRTLRYYIYPIDSPGTIIGSINFFRMLPAPFSSAAIGYKLHHDYWGKGYATEACRAAIISLFSDYDVHRLEAKVSPDNIRSIHLLERLGFTYEGPEYKSVEIQGIFRDHLRYSLLNDDYSQSSTIQ